MTQSPRRAVAQAWGKPSKSQLPVPLADGSWLGGLLHAIHAVLAGCMGRRTRAHRFGKPAITRRASASHAQPMRTSSAQRLRKPRPGIRGGTSLTNHAARTRGRNPFAPLGESPPPGGGPWSGERRAPDSSPPAWSHLPRSRNLPPSRPLGWIPSRRGPQASLSTHPPTAAATIQARCNVRHCSRSACHAWCGLGPCRTPWATPCNSGSKMAASLITTARWPSVSSQQGGPSGLCGPASCSLQTRAPGGATDR
jgi:hypothetical protein